ncbi:hypothetical protein M404DRAFT_1008030, partial [Pisolithus tinctorius Marx 270]
TKNSCSRWHETRHDGRRECERTRDPNPEISINLPKGTRLHQKPNVAMSSAATTTEKVPF